MDIAAILVNKFNGAEWTLNANDYKQLDWLSETPKKPTEAKLKEFWPAVQAAQQAEAEAIIATRKSALAKLAKLGLTEAEIASL